MEWNRGNVFKFIDLYHKNEILWDPHHGEHYHNAKKRDAWEEIGKQMGANVEDCKKKMEYLLAALRREKMKMKKSIGTGKGACEVYKSSWFAYNSMQFLWDKNKPRTTLSTIPKVMRQFETPTEPAECEDLSVALDTVLEESLEVNPITLKQKGTVSSKVPLKRQKKNTAEEQRLDKAFEMLQSAANVGDDSSHFGNFVASKLRNYDDNVRCAIQADILNIFVRANTGFYNRATVLTSHLVDNAGPSYSSSPTCSDFPVCQPEAHFESHSEHSTQYQPAPSSHFQTDIMNCLNNISPTSPSLDLQ